MPVKSKQVVIDKLTDSARRIRTVREAAQRFKQAQALGEPEPIRTAQAPIVPGSPIGGKP